MYFINPFRGLRPNEEKASSVSIPSTAHLSEAIIAKHKKNNPGSYLNIFNPDYQNSKTQSEIYTKAKEQFELMKNNSVIIKDSTKSFYIYKISTKNHSQVGIVGTAKLSAYDNLHIRGHEEIYFERSQKRFDQIKNLNAQIGPIYVIYPDNVELTELIEKHTTLKPKYSIVALDKCQHELWILNKQDIVLKISELFNTIIESTLQMGIIELRHYQNCWNLENTIIPTTQEQNPIIILWWLYFQKVKRVYSTTID